MGMIVTYARAVRIYEIPGTNPIDTRADVLLTDGTVEHYDWNNSRHQKELKKLIDHLVNSEAVVVLHFTGSIHKHERTGRTAKQICDISLYVCYQVLKFLFRIQVICIGHVVVLKHFDFSAVGIKVDIGISILYTDFL